MVSSLFDTLFTTKDLCQTSFELIQDFTGAGVGATTMGYLFVYGAIIFLAFVLFGLSRNILVGIFSADIIYVIIMLYGAAGCAPIPVGMAVLGTIMFSILTLLGIIAWKMGNTSSF